MGPLEPEVAEGSWVCDTVSTSKMASGCRQTWAHLPRKLLNEL